MHIERCKPPSVHMQLRPGIVPRMSDTTSPPIGDVIRSWVQQILAHERMDATAFARRISISQATLSRLLSGNTDTPMPRTLRALAQHSPIAVPAPIQKLLDSAPAPAGEQGVNIGLSPSTDIPIWGVHPLPASDEFHMNPTPVNTLRRPPAMLMARRIIAFYAPDETMAPRWNMGEPVLVDLHRPATIGAYCLARLTPTHDPNADEVYLFRRYDGRRAGKVFFSTAAGSLGETGVAIKRILDVRRVLDWTDLLT